MIPGPPAQSVPITPGKGKGKKAKSTETETPDEFVAWTAGKKAGEKEAENRWHHMFFVIDIMWGLGEGNSLVSGGRGQCGVSGG